MLLHEIPIIYPIFLTISGTNFNLLLHTFCSMKLIGKALENK